MFGMVGILESAILSFIIDRIKLSYFCIKMYTKVVHNKLSKQKIQWQDAFIFKNFKKAK